MYYGFGLRGLRRNAESDLFSDLFIVILSRLFPTFRIRFLPINPIFYAIFLHLLPLLGLTSPMQPFR